MKRRALLPWLLVLAIPLVAADLQTADEIEECVRGNQPESSSVQTIAFRVKDRIGAVTESQAKIYWKKGDDGLSRLMMRFARPPDLRGAGLLLLERKNERRDMFMYLPELNKVKRISSRMMSGSMFGTDFSYEDFERFEGFEQDDGLERLDDADLDGKKVYVLVHRPTEEADSAYQRIVKYVDQETCVPLKTEFYGRGDRLRKVAVSNSARLTREGNGWLPRHTTLRDLRDETETDLIISEVEVNVEIHRKMFSQRELEAGRHR